MGECIDTTLYDSVIATDIYRCIFVWHLSPELTRVMHDRLMELGHKVPASIALDSAR